LKVLRHPRWKFEATDDVATALEESDDCVWDSPSTKSFSPANFAFFKPPETPREPLRTLSQAEVDRDTKMMTCGVDVEEHFWPIRYQIRHGKLQVRIWPVIYGVYIELTNLFALGLRGACRQIARPLGHLTFVLQNTIRELSVHAHRNGQWTALSELTSELESHKEWSDFSLTSFLNESCRQRERLFKVRI
jgi:hypothetical protein